MITIPDAVSQIINKTPFLEEGLRQGIINNSSLARQIHSEIENITFKEVQTGAIIIALNRLSQTLKKRAPMVKFTGTPDLMVRSNLVEITFSNSDTLTEKLDHLLQEIITNKNSFFTISGGIFETMIVVSQEVLPKIEEIFADEKVVAKFQNVTSITVKITQKLATTPGSLYIILKSIAGKGINVVDVISTYTEFTIFVKNKDFDEAFSAIKGLYS